ncbi:MAG TPA: zinc-binding alcohol dehydrogenase family protein [Rhizomicrobium sp.]|jgi:NADPH:quinone reductase-like Zn-dependent oxidoreductase
MPKNMAPWAVKPHQKLQVKEAPYTEPKAGEVLVRNHAVAVNPVDWMIPVMGKTLFNWLKFPLIGGYDLAGEVVAVGSGVTGIKPGDRVLADAAGLTQSRNRNAESAYQLYTIVLPRLTTNIPDTLSYEDACVVPLAAMTAACALFQKDALALPLPAMDTRPRNEWVLITGGATSVGCNAIQLAKGAGYNVVTTSSPKNFDYLKSLGADLVFDYHSRTVTQDILAAMAGKHVAGAVALGSGSVLTCMDVLAKTKGGKFVSNMGSPVSFDAVQGLRVPLLTFMGLGLKLLRSALAMRLRTARTGVTQKFFDASSTIDNEVGPAIFRDYLVPALAAGKFKAAPPPRVVGEGLEHVQTAFDVQRKGVSASKIVVTL